EQPQRAAVGPELAEEAADERRLAGAVATEQGVDHAAIDVDRDVVHGRLASVADGEVVDFDDAVSHEVLLLCSRTTRSNADSSSSTASSSSAPTARAVLAWREGPSGSASWRSAFFGGSR